MVEILIEGNENLLHEIHLGEEFQQAGYHFRVLPTFDKSIDDALGEEYYFVFTSASQLANAYMRNLSITVNPTSQNILTFTLSGENPEKLIGYLNTLCSKYILNDMTLRNRMANNTIAFIDGQLGILNEQLKEAEQKLIHYRRENRLYGISVDDKAVTELFQMETILQEVSIERKSLKDLLINLDSLKLSYSLLLPDFYSSSSPLVSQGLSSLNELVVERKVLLKNESVKSPAIKAIEQKIDVQVDVLRTYIKNGLRHLNEEEAQIKAEVSKLEYEMMDIPAEERQLTKLQRDFELSENIYNLYQQKRIEAVLAKASTVSKIRVLDPATPETVQQVKPQKQKNQQTGWIIGFIIPLALIILIDSFSSVLHSESEIRNKTAIPIIGKVPHSTLKSTLVTNDFPASSVAEAFRSMLARLEVNNAIKNQQVISITSGASGEGKTFTSVNLSIIFSKSGNKTLLIGLDLRRPQLHKLLEVSNGEGLTTYLSRRTDRKNLIKTTQVANLDFIPSGPIPPNPVELIQNKSLESLLLELRKIYDYIIIDTPPLGMVADAMLINRYTDVNFFIIRINHSKRGIIPYIDELNRSGTVNHLHIVLNDINVNDGYGYGGKSYKYYYYHEKEPTVFSKLRKRFLKK